MERVEERGGAGGDRHSSQGGDEWGTRLWGWSTGARGPGKRGEPSAERCALRAGRMVERRKPCHTRLGWSSGRWRGWRNAVARGAIATHHKGAMNGVPGCGVGVPERAGQGREASLRQSGARFARAGWWRGVSRAIPDWGGPRGDGEGGGTRWRGGRSPLITRGR